MTTTAPQVADAPVKPDAVREPAETDLTPDKAVTLVQRVLMPRPADPLKVRSLYLDEENAPIRVRQDGRYSGSIVAGSEVSFATYFNAFPASYWRRWSVLGSIVLRVTVSGTCRIDAHRSQADGGAMHVPGVAPHGGAAGGARALPACGPPARAPAGSTSPAPRPTASRCTSPASRTRAPTSGRWSSTSTSPRSSTAGRTGSALPARAH